MCTDRPTPDTGGRRAWCSTAAVADRLERINPAPAQCRRPRVPKPLTSPAAIDTYGEGGGGNEEGVMVGKRGVESRRMLSITSSR